MPGFLSKLFRRKGGEDGNNKKAKKPSKRGAGRLKSRPSKDSKEEPAEPLQQQATDHMNRAPTVATVSDRGSSAGRQQQQQPNKSVISPRVDTSRRMSGGPVDLDDTDMEGSDENRNASPRLSFHQLQQFNRQSASQNSASHLYTHSHDALDNSMEHGSDASSSDFNLSTDAEDTEYENLKRRGGAPYGNSSNLDTSGLSQMSSPTNYTTDDDNAIFPALQTDDDATATEQDDSLAPDDEAHGMQIVPMAHETEDDMRAWTLSPTSQPSTKSDSKALSPTFRKKGYNKSTNNNSKSSTTPKVVEVEQAPPADAFARDAFDKDTFGNFANFDAVFPMEQSKQQSTRPFPFETSVRKASSSASAAPQQETSLSDLLAQAKRKSHSSGKRGSSSVNSAPVITADYLRKTHKLGQHRSSRDSDSRSVDKTTSVSDIIQSLEATNASRLKTSRSGSRTHRSSSDTHSHASNGGTSTRSAKERLREKRRQERARLGSDESDNEEGESWLFDEVAGTLGPRGVAADMESLGGRSNRSKNSASGKSNRSHRSHKSHRSHRSSRRKKSSSESVDSRNSRSSRYSHRSTRSYLSQMSEQSRSVANDLLRLEMQLAMVGSQEVNGDGDNAAASGSVAGSTGGASRASRTSRTNRTRSSTHRTPSVSKRSKMTVIAPPGKLGIILANKADSKGTVVSGVRTSSVLAEKISPGDRIIAIDGEDVSLMTVSEITTIMARKSDFERQLTIMTTPKHLGLTSHQSRGDYGEADGYYRR